VVDIASIVIRQSKGYLPTLGQIEGGPYMAIEPVYTVNLTVDELTDAFEKVIAAGHPQIPEPTKEEMQRRKDPILKAAGVKSWKALAKCGATYSIEWGEDFITLYISRLDRKGRFEVDPTKTRTFSKGTPLRTIVEAILEDAHSRPELWVADNISE
jgi:hypothetical protein